jgi:hypothetical protein
MGRPRLTPAARFVKYTIAGPGGCLFWTGSITAEGYGKITIPADGEDWRNGLRTWPAHRLRWVLANGPIPPNLVVHHKCGVRRCVELSHLELLTAPENSASGRRKPSSRVRGPAVRPYRYISPDERAAILAGRASGESVSALAETFDRSSGTILYAIRRYS